MLKSHTQEPVSFPISWEMFALGWKETLCGLEVPAERIAEPPTCQRCQKSQEVREEVNKEDTSMEEKKQEQVAETTRAGEETLRTISSIDRMLHSKPGPDHICTMPFDIAPGGPYACAGGCGRMWDIVDAEKYKQIQEALREASHAVDDPSRFWSKNGQKGVNFIEHWYALVGEQ